MPHDAPLLSQLRQQLQRMIHDLDGLPLNEAMIRALPKIDLHVHLPGTIAPATAWELGRRNGFIDLHPGPSGAPVRWSHGSKQLSIHDAHEHYTDIFADLPPDHRMPLLEDLRYAIDYQSFKSFDRIMATVQGHRHPPGGIQTPEDFRLVLRAYRNDCLRQHITYTEVQQNIRIASFLFPEDESPAARRKLYALLQEAIQDYASVGIHLRFLHCFNKTQAAGVSTTARERALEAAQWLEEARDCAPDVFVGLQAAGHEKDPTGWPEHLADGYHRAHASGFGCEAHGGEGIGVTHMMEVARRLPVTRIAHGFQVVEDPKAIEEIRERNITLLVSPVMNLMLGAYLHYPDHRQEITFLDQHPFFDMLRHHRLNVSLCSDNPRMGALPIQELMMVLAGLPVHHAPVPLHHLRCSAPMTAGELIGCLVRSMEAAFCNDTLRTHYYEQLYQAAVDHLWPMGTHGSGILPPLTIATD